MGQVRVFTFMGSVKAALRNRKLTDGKNIDFTMQPELKIYIEDWDKMTALTQNAIRTDLVNWSEGTE